VNTSNVGTPGCPACAEKRLHSAEELKFFHEAAGKGFDKIGNRTKKEEEEHAEHK